MFDIRRVSKRIIATLFAAQSLSSAAVIAMAPIIPIVATQLSGDNSMAGLPNSIGHLSSAPAAFLWGLLWDRVGRRFGLSLGLTLGILGAGLALISFQSGSFLLFLVSFAILGFARAAMQLGRFIASEVSPPAQRGQAISYVVLGGTVGAVLGPLLVDPSGKMALNLGWDELAGPFGISILLFIIAAAVSFLGLRPEPNEIALEVDRQFPQAEKETSATRSIKELLRLPGVQVAVPAMGLSQMVMVMVMGMTSLHMKANRHELDSISLVFMAHTLGMFAFSILTGKLVDRWGRAPVILSGVGMLLASFVVAPIDTTTFSLAVALFLLGLGWNFCFVGGSVLLSDQLQPAERSRTQGFNDVFIGLASAVGSYGSGLILAAWGYGTLSLIAAVIVLALLALVLWWSIKHNPSRKKLTSIE